MSLRMICYAPSGRAFPNTAYQPKPAEDQARRSEVTDTLLLFADRFRAFGAAFALTRLFAHDILNHNILCQHAMSGKGEIICSEQRIRN